MCSIFLNIIFFKSLFIWKRIFCYYDDNKIDMLFQNTYVFRSFKKTCSKNQDLIIYTGLALFLPRWDKNFGICSNFNVIFSLYVQKGVNNILEIIFTSWIE